jgi:hypothetical protein
MAERQAIIKHKLSTDLAKLMKQRTDLDAMRHLIVAMQAQQSSQQSAQPSSSQPSTSAATAKPAAFAPQTTIAAWNVAQAQHPVTAAATTAGSQPPIEVGQPLFHNASLDLVCSVLCSLPVTFKLTFLCVCNVNVCG